MGGNTDGGSMARKKPRNRREWEDCFKQQRERLRQEQEWRRQEQERQRQEQEQQRQEQEQRDRELRERLQREEQERERLKREEAREECLALERQFSPLANAFCTGTEQDFQAVEKLYQRLEWLLSQYPDLL